MFDYFNFWCEGNRKKKKKVALLHSALINQEKKKPLRKFAVLALTTLAALVLTKRI